MAWEQIINRNFNQSYEGPAQLCDWTFTVPLPDQLGTSWLANKLINGHIDELRKQGSRLLELRVWEDAAPTWQTDYYVEVVASTAENEGISALPLAWAVIIVGVLVVLAIAGLTYALVKTEDIINYIGEKAGGLGISLTLLLGISAMGLGIVALTRKRGKTT